MVTNLVEGGKVIIAQIIDDEIHFFLNDTNLLIFSPHFIAEVRTILARHGRTVREI